MFKGNFKLKNSAGKPVTYSNGDVVIYQGKMYQCRGETQKTPFQQPTNWQYTGSTEIVISIDPPLNPKIGQVWVADTGRSYVWFTDQDGSQWIET